MPKKTMTTLPSRRRHSAEQRGRGMAKKKRQQPTAAVTAGS